MIFRTITNDITGANKSIGLFGLSLKNISDKLYDVQALGLKGAFSKTINTPTIDVKAIERYNTLLTQNSDAQKALTIASKNTNSATIALMKSANGTTISTEQMTAAQKASTVAAKAQSAAYKAVSVAANMIAYALIAKGIQLAADAIDHYVNRAKYAAEAMEEAQQKIDDAQNSLKNMSTTLSENKDRFLELSQGVDKFSKNLRLSEEDYAEYLSISNELAELFPTLVSGYDEQGNALLSIGHNADETNEKLQSLLETQQAIAQQTLIDNMDDVANGIYYEVEDAKNSIEEMEIELDSLQQQNKKFNIDIASSKGVISFSDDDYSKYGKAMEDALMSAGIEFEKNTSAGLYDTAIQLISASPEQLTQAQKFYDAWLETENKYFHASENGLKQDIEEKKKTIENSYSKMTANLQAWMKDNYNYQYLSDNASDLANALVPEIKWDELEEPPTTAWDYQNYVEENIIKPLMEVPQKHRQEIDNMFKELLSFEDGDLDVLSFAEKLQARLKELGIEIDITPIIADEQEAKNRLQNSIEAIAEGGSADFTTSSGIKVDADDYKKLQEYTKDFDVEQEELWNKVTLGAKNAEDAINKYEKALKVVADSDEITDSFADIFNSADFSEVKAELLELAKSGELTTATLTSTEEYNNLLSKTGLLAGDAKDKILDMLSAQDKLSAASQGLDNLKSAYEEFKDEEIGFVTAETLSSLPDAFKELKGFDLFSQIVGDPTSGTKKIQQAFNDIAKEYLVEQRTLTGLSRENMNSYIANIKQMGITNAEEVVNTVLTNLESTNTMIEQAEKEYIQCLNDGTAADLDHVQTVMAYNQKLASALGASYKKDYETWCELLKLKSEAYNDFVERIGGSYDSELSTIQNMMNNGKDMGTSNIADALAAEAKLRDAEYQLKKQSEILKIDMTPIDTNFGGGYSPNTGSDKGKKDSSSAKTFNWVETLLDKLSKKTDELKEKFEEAFSLTKAKTAFKKAISQITKEIKANEKAVAYYEKKANGVKLSSKYKKLVDNGAIKIENITDEALAEQIELYQDYKDNADACRETIDDLRDSYAELAETFYNKPLELREEKLEKIDTALQLLDSKIENASTPGERNKYAKKKEELYKNEYASYETAESTAKSNLGTTKKAIDQKSDKALKGLTTAQKKKITGAVAKGMEITDEMVDFD